MDNLKKQLTRHESLGSHCLQASAANAEILFRKVTLLQDSLSQWTTYCQHLETSNRSLNELNNGLLSRIAILEEVPIMCS